MPHDFLSVAFELLKVSNKDPAGMIAKYLKVIANYYWIKCLVNSVLYFTYREIKISNSSFSEEMSAEVGNKRKASGLVYGGGSSERPDRLIRSRTAKP